MKSLYILGATDPEMDRMKEILTETGEETFIATKDGKRVHAANAYEADLSKRSLPEGYEYIFIECRIPGVSVGGVIDHHSPGHPGFGKGPGQFWEASSLGQLCTRLCVAPTKNDYILAAMDHCYNAAMQGKCPGINTKDVFGVKVASIMKATSSTKEEVADEIERFREVIPSSSVIVMGDQMVLNFKEDLGVGYSLPYLSAQVAIVIDNIPVILHVRDKDGGPVRLHLCGDTKPQTVEYFMDVWALDNKLTKIYGAPSRGYAGGYLAGEY